MSWKGFVLGVGVGIAVSIAVAIWHPRALPDHLIIFAPFSIYDSSAHNPDDGMAYVKLTGSIVGGGDQAFGNNSITVECWHLRNACISGTVDQISNSQLGSLDLQEWTVQSWTAQNIVLLDDELCGSTTINIDRLAKHVSYVNQRKQTADGFCKDGRVFTYTIEEPSAWRILHVKTDAKTREK